MTPASSKEFLNIQAAIESGFILKRVRDMTRRYRDIFNEQLSLISYYFLFYEQTNLAKESNNDHILEAAPRQMFSKVTFLKISQGLQEKFCARALFLIQVETKLSRKHLCWSLVFDIVTS